MKCKSGRNPALAIHSELWQQEENKSWQQENKQDLTTNKKNKNWREEVKILIRLIRLISLYS